MAISDSFGTRYESIVRARACDGIPLYFSFYETKIFSTIEKNSIAVVFILDAINLQLL